MTKQILKNIGLTLASSLLLIASWPPSSLNFLLFIAFVPVMIVIFEQKKVLHVIAFFYLCFQFFLLEMHWPLLIEGNHVMPLVVGFFLVPLFWSVPLIFSFLIKKKYNLTIALLLLPFFYVSQEVAQYYWDFAVTWFHLGLGLSKNPYFLGIYPYLGQEGGSFLIIATNAGMYYVYHQYMQHKLQKLDLLPVLSISLILIISNIIKPKAINSGTADIAVFQPSSKQVEVNKDNLEAQINLLENALKESDFKKADLLVCAESYLFDMIKYPLIVNNLDQHSAIRRLMEISAKYQTPIFSGATLVRLYRSKYPPNASAKMKEPGVYFDIYNGSIFITPDNKVSWRTKQSLVPFVEIIPFHKFFNFLEKHHLWPTRYDRTYGTVAFEGPYKYGKLNVAPAICFESLFPQVMASYIQGEANLQVVLSTNWTESESLLMQQQDGMLVDARSFGIPLVFATLDQSSSITSSEGLSFFAQKTLDIKTIILSDTSSLYLKIAKYPWYWCILTLFITFTMFIIHNNNLKISSIN